MKQQLTTTSNARTTKTSVMACYAALQAAFCCAVFSRARARSGLFGRRTARAAALAPVGAVMASGAFEKDEQIKCHGVSCKKLGQYFSLFPFLRTIPPPVR